ncbi:MAG: right-handed parallel beta-helix repeat-containing protein [Pseudomonadota bacterium]
MLIKDQAPKKARPRRTEESRKRFRRRLALAGLALAALVAALAAGFYLGGYTPAREKFSHALSEISGDFSLPKRAARYWQGLHAQPRRLVLDIAQKDWQRLAFEREKALEKGLIITGEDSWVPATVQADGKSHKVKVRLKGDVADHLEGNKWSLRIQTKGDGRVWGMKRFSIQDPQRSGYIKEWVFHHLLAWEGLIGLRYEFIRVTINGRDMGVYALEEAFAKEAIEHNERREGPILKFDESRLFDESKDEAATTASQRDIFLTADITCFQTDQVYANPDLKREFLAGRNLLAGFRAGELTCSQVFDVPRAARAFAVMGIMNGYHAFRWKNIRFYYNPVTARLEIIPYNAYGPYRGMPVLVPPYSLLYFKWLFGPAEDEVWVKDWMDLFFRDPVFTDAFFAEMEKITAEGHLEAFFRDKGAEFEAMRSVLYMDDTGPLEDEVIFLHNRNVARDILRPETRIKAFLAQAGGGPGGGMGMDLLVANTAFLPMTLVALETSSGQAYTRLAPARLEGRPVSGAMALQTVHVEDFDPAANPGLLAATERASQQVVLSDLFLTYRIRGTQNILRARIDPNPITSGQPMPVSKEDATTRINAVIRAGMLAVDTDTGEMTIRKGKWRLPWTLLLPAGGLVRVEAGAVLDLTQGASLISLSPMRFAGTPEAPIRIMSSDGLGRGLAVISAKGQSEMTHVIVSGLDAPAKGDWKLTGAVTFHESDVVIRSCAFGENRSEDGVNIIRSHYEIRDCSFASTFSDALDTDFSTGVITDTTFARCGNDCADLSGGSHQISRITVDQAGDKGISAGEGTRVMADTLSISGVKVGVASKDGSEVELSGTRLSNCRYGLAAYQKKPEYSGGSLTATGTVMENVETPYLLEEGSSILDNGHKIEPGKKPLTTAPMLEAQP